MSDGDIEYSKYTLRELEEALAGINRQRYPKNYANLRSTYDHRTAAIALPFASTEVADNSDANQEPTNNWWGKFWGSRPVLGIVGLFCLWWAYDLLSHPNSCPSGGKLIGDLVKATCENFGQAAAAGIPILLAVLSLVLVIRPRVRAGA
jgi:hypothetical protein